jgi:hypothetical protein
MEVLVKTLILVAVLLLGAVASLASFYHLKPLVHATIGRDAGCLNNLQILGLLSNNKSVMISGFCDTGGVLKAKVAIDMAKFCTGLSFNLGSIQFGTFVSCVDKAALIASLSTQAHDITAHCDMTGQLTAQFRCH